MKTFKDILIKVYVNTPKFMLVMIALCLSLQEFYPFSHFPMYSRFDVDTTYLYLTDENDQPIAIADNFKYSAAQIKKMFQKRAGAATNLSEADIPKRTARQKAGAMLLQDILKESDAQRLKQFSKLKLFLVKITLEGNKIHRQKSFLAEIVL